MPAATSVATSAAWRSSVTASHACATSCRVFPAVGNELHRPVVVVCGHLDEADDLADDIELFLGRRPDVLPALELGGSLGQLSEEQVSNRLQLVSRLATEKTAPQASPLLIA